MLGKWAIAISAVAGLWSWGAVAQDIQPPADPVARAAFDVA